MNTTLHTYRIWTLWTDLAEYIGRTVQAPDPDTALEIASRMGDFAGLGYQWPRYQGAHAQRVTG